MVGAAVIGEAVVGAEVVLLLSAAVVDAVEALVASGVIVDVFLTELLVNCLKSPNVPCDNDKAAIAAT